MANLWLPDNQFERPDRFIPGRKPNCAVEIDRGNGFGRKAGIVQIFSSRNRLDDLTNNQLATLHGSANVGPKGLTLGGGTDQARSLTTRHIFTGTGLTVIALIELGSVSPIGHQYVLCTDGNFVRLWVNIQVPEVQVNGQIYIANAWRGVSGFNYTVTPAVGQKYWIALTFNQPSAKVHIAPYRGNFISSVGNSYGAPLDDEGGSLIYGAIDTSGTTPFTGVIENIYLTNSFMGMGELNRFIRDPYQIVISR